jgi:prepilin-type N-terminal cleavage/methylation domain-containing protein
MNEKGFSLIELIIVIAIMAILIAIIAPNLTRYLHRSKEETDIRNMDEVRHQVFNCISEAATKNIGVISGGLTTAYYELEYDSSNEATKAVSKSDGVDEFASLLTDTLADATTVSSKDKSKNKMEIKISKSVNKGYDVSVRYTS